MKNRIFDLLLIILPFFTIAQDNEVGLFVGSSLYQGDLAPSQVLTSFGQAHLSIGGFYKYNFNKFLTLKLGLTQGSLSGDDQESKEQGRKDRNLNFTSSLSEFSIITEFNILGYQPYDKRSYSPYFYLGIAFFHFNPKTVLNGISYELQPLGTEGQFLPQVNNSPYKLTQISIPIGFGFKYSLNKDWTLGIEGGSRFTFTDYIDDVSTNYVGDHEWEQIGDGITGSLANRGPKTYLGGEPRGEPKNDDWYIIGGIIFSYNFKGNGLLGFLNKNKRAEVKCPVF